jgi:hypothetical protein
VIVLPKSDKGSPEDLLPRLKLLQSEYKELIKKDESNAVLGNSEEYYKLYSREDVEALMQKSVMKKPANHDEWIVTAIKHIDIENVQFPLILVQEYGMNLFRFGAGTKLALEHMPNVTFKNNTMVQQVQRDNKKWHITYHTSDITAFDEFDYLINATGFRTGKIDDMVGVKSEKMVEFKASFISKWEEKSDMVFPEIIFHGERGTPQGMAQFTPYPGGYFQLHGMTNEITLYEDGLVSSTEESSYPRLKNHFIQKLDSGWSTKEVESRTNNAIKHVQQYIPEFTNAKLGAFPLFGAQQIPGYDPTLRVAEVSFPISNYCRCEIVKVSSSLDMIDAIVADLVKLSYIDVSFQGSRSLDYLKHIDEDTLSVRAQELAQSRGYPSDLAKINVSKPI